MAVGPASDVDTSNGLISRSNLNTQLRLVIELLNATNTNELKDQLVLHGHNIETMRDIKWVTLRKWRYHFKACPS